MSARIVVLASGNGSNLQAVIDACAGGDLRARVVAVISDRADAYALHRGADADIAALHLPINPGETRASFDQRLAAAVNAAAPDLVVLAGWMRILSNSFLGACTAPVINLHPALPGEFPGTRSIERAFAERETRSTTGAMVHYVCDEGVDDGPTIATVSVPILSTDTLDTLTTRMHHAEHQLLIQALKMVLEEED